MVRRARLSQGKDLEGAQASFSVSVASRVIEEGQSILAEDALSDARFDGHSSIANLRLRSLLCVPMRGGEVLGALYLDNPYESGKFDGWDVRLLESFATLASIALRNARQRREMAVRRREAVRQARRIERLNERLKRALRIRTDALRRAREDLAKQADELGLKYTYEHIVGRSPAMRRVLELADRVTDLKHPRAPRRGVRARARSCSRAPSTSTAPAGAARLVGGELRGHPRDARWRASSSATSGGPSPARIATTPGSSSRPTRGRSSSTRSGEMSPDLQKKFLRVLEEGEVRRAGREDDPIPVDFRLISATNRDLTELLAPGRLPRGPLLPARRGGHRDPAAPGAQGGHRRRWSRPSSGT